MVVMVEVESVLKMLETASEKLQADDLTAVTVTINIRSLLAIVRP